MHTETMIFNSKKDAQRVNRRLRERSIISSTFGREVMAYIPKDMAGGGDTLRELMKTLVR